MLLGSQRLLCCANLYVCCNIYPNFLACDFSAAPWILHIYMQFDRPVIRHFRLHRASLHYIEQPFLPIQIHMISGIPMMLSPLRIELLFIVLEMQHLHVPSGYGTLNNSACITRNMLSMSVGSRELDENQAFFLAL